MYFPTVTEREFLQTLEYAEPSYVLEFRSAPRFDIGKLTRQLAFQAFSDHGSTYIDLASSLMGRHDTAALLGDLWRFFENMHCGFERPIMFLINPRELSEEFTAKIVETVSSFNAGPAVIYEVPRFEELSDSAAL